jgi:hypothetical protein
VLGPASPSSEPGSLTPKHDAPAILVGASADFGLSRRAHDRRTTEAEVRMRLVCLLGSREPATKSDVGGLSHLQMPPGLVRSVEASMLFAKRAHLTALLRPARKDLTGGPLASILGFRPRHFNDPVVSCPLDTGRLSCAELHRPDRLAILGRTHCWPPRAPR